MKRPDFGSSFVGIVFGICFLSPLIADDGSDTKELLAEERADQSGKIFYVEKVISLRGATTTVKLPEVTEGFERRIRLELVNESEKPQNIFVKSSCVCLKVPTPFEIDSGVKREVELTLRVTAEKFGTEVSFVDQAQDRVTKIRFEGTSKKIIDIGAGRLPIKGTVSSFVATGRLSSDVESVDTEGAKLTSGNELFESIKFTRKDQQFEIEGKAKSGTTFSAGEAFTCSVPIKLLGKSEIANYSISLEFRALEETSFFPSSLRIVKREGILKGKAILTAENLRVSEFGTRFHLALFAKGEDGSEIPIDNSYVRMQRLAAAKWVIMLEIPEDCKTNCDKGVVRLVVEGAPITSMEWTLEE